jgi:hypothetical protein
MWVQRQLVEAKELFTPKPQQVTMPDGSIQMVDVNIFTNPKALDFQAKPGMTPAQTAQLNKPTWDSERGIWVTPPQQGSQVASASPAAAGPTAAPQAGQPLPAAPVAAPASPAAPILPKAEIERQAKLKVEKPKDIKSLRNVLPTIQQMRDEAQAILDDPGLGMATGFTGSLKVPFTDVKPLLWPGTEGRGADARIQTLKAKTFGSVITAMREASKTGGLVGNMSDAEGARFENMVASLDQAQSEEDFRDRLQQIINYTTELERNVIAGFKDQYGEEPNIPRSQVVVNRHAAKPSDGKSGGIKFLGFESP